MKRTGGRGAVPPLGSSSAVSGLPDEQRRGSGGKRSKRSSTAQGENDPAAYRSDHGAGAALAASSGIRVSFVALSVSAALACG